jgi:hypothetical protein
VPWQLLVLGRQQQLWRQWHRYRHLLLLVLETSQVSSRQHEA